MAIGKPSQRSITSVHHPARMKEEKEQGEREGEREKQGVRRRKRMLLKTNVKKEKEKKENSAQHAVKADHYESINA